MDEEDDVDDGILDVPGDTYEPVLEEGTNYVATPSSVIVDGVRYVHPVIPLPRIEISIPGYKDFEVTSLSVRLNVDPALPSPGHDDDDDVVYLGTFSPSSPSPEDEVILLD